MARSRPKDSRTQVAQTSTGMGTSREKTERTSGNKMETHIKHAMIDRDLRVGEWNVRELWRKKTANS
nr:unnamed protein product [Callosobruchus chinensis]